MPDLRIVAAAQVTPSCMLLAAEQEGPADLVEVSLAREGRGQETLPAEAIVVPPAEAGQVAILLLRVVLPAGGRTDASVAVRSGDATSVIAERDLNMLVLDLQTFLRDHVAGHDAGTRARATEFLAGSLAVAPASERYELGDQLFGIRQALRERLPAFGLDKARRRGLQVDKLLAVDERSFYAEGWLHYEDAPLKRLTAVSPGGARAELLDSLVRTSRPDVAQVFELRPHEAQEKKLGFVCFFQLDAPSVRSDGWVFELEDVHGVTGEISGPRVTSDPHEVREAIIDDPKVEKLPNEALMRDHIYPAVRLIQERLASETQVDSVVQYGTPPESPDVSIVVPLYGHIEHVEVQLSQLADDPDIATSDLIYVLDSPQDAAYLRRYAAELHPIYGIPFRVVTLVSNVGFASACNVGATFVRGRLLLLMNSDVLPAGPGWLGRLRDFYDATPNIGALGPKMLYEDDSIQHAGMHFVPFPDPGLGLWVDSTYYKGMHSSLPAANVTRPVPAVSGACLMIDRELWEEVGGLQRIYVRGDYEDSHLCLELIERGRENWYMADAALYHLEGQSYTSALRGPSNRFNSWVYSRLWNERIESLMERSEYSVNGGVPRAV
jgi:GT2 family glycosyltransferase